MNQSVRKSILAAGVAAVVAAGAHRIQAQETKGQGADQAKVEQLTAARGVRTPLKAGDSLATLFIGAHRFTIAIQSVTAPYRIRIVPENNRTISNPLEIAGVVDTSFVTPAVVRTGPAAGLFLENVSLVANQNLTIRFDQCTAGSNPLQASCRYVQYLYNNVVSQTRKRYLS